jgi:hypothetical protein
MSVSVLEGRAHGKRAALILGSRKATQNGMAAMQGLPRSRNVLGDYIGN